MIYIFYRQTIAAPIIDAISDKTFEFEIGSLRSVGGFSQNFDFDWFVRHPKTDDFTLPYE